MNKYNKRKKQLLKMYRKDTESFYISLENKIKEIIKHKVIDNNVIYSTCGFDIILKKRKLIIKLYDSNRKVYRNIFGNVKVKAYNYYDLNKFSKNYYDFWICRSGTALHTYLDFLKENIGE